MKIYQKMTGETPEVRSDKRKPRQIIEIIVKEQRLYRVFFLTGAPLKVLSVRLQSKSYQKSSKCQNLLTGWHLGFLGGHQLKKTPCTIFTALLHIVALTFDP